MEQLILVEAKREQMVSSTSFERNLAVQLRSVGNGLLNAPSSIDQLLTLLDRAEELLANVEQQPSDFLLDALLPVMKGLIAEAPFKNSNGDVRVTVASCFSEILRITSPQQPFNDKQMKEIFQLIVEVLSMLSYPSTPCYEKALSALATIARVKACLLMLDLECEVLVLQMCQHLWVIIRSNPSADAFWAVEQIMTDILTESEDIGPDLLHPLLASVLKENEKVAPSCWKLGEKLFSNCAAKLRPILKGALQLKGTTLDDYSPVVASIYQNEISISRSNLSAMPVVSPRKRRNALKSDVETLRDEAALVPSDLRDKKMKLPTIGRSNASTGTFRV
ncbi:hypothetical protein BT93_G1943 [Corymbia citriodora subsp. variegata]|nr:hypothetical protein BT93_G1943 [Corymbia citriodora subsp. variegata]